MSDFSKHRKFFAEFARRAENGAESESDFLSRVFTIGELYAIVAEGELLRAREMSGEYAVYDGLPLILMDDPEQKCSVLKF